MGLKYSFVLIILLIFFNCFTINSNTTPKELSLKNTQLYVDTLKFNINNIEKPDSLRLTNYEYKPKKNFITKVLDYFKDSNKEKEEKKFDFSIIGGPHYSSDTQFGIGLVGAGLYRMDRNDKTIPASNVTLFGDISTVGFYLIGIRGNNIFPHDRFRLNYKISLYSFPSYYWGIGYENGNNDDNKTKMKRFESKLHIEFTYRLFENLYIGPYVCWDFAKASDMPRPELLNGLGLINRNYGFGLTLNYDSRNVLTNPSKGFYVNVTQAFRPKWLANDHAFNSTDVTLAAYTKAWKGSIIAGQIEAQFNYGNPSWAMMAQLGGSNSMRGYYEGRYRDKHMLQAQVELRQHIWRRNSLTLWVGTGSVFHDKKSFKHFLPNYGLGYRWEFKKDVNVRLDLGFGKKGQWGFIFNINEAF